MIRQERQVTNVADVIRMRQLTIDNVQDRQWQSRHTVTKLLRKTAKIQNRTKNIKLQEIISGRNYFYARIPFTFGS